jgi:hypothetical protein
MFIQELERLIRELARLKNIFVRKGLNQDISTGQSIVAHSENSDMDEVELLILPQFLWCHL